MELAVERFEEIDTNHNGVIEFDEALIRAGNTTTVDSWQLFVRMDANGNRLIEPGELDNMLRFYKI